MRRLRALAARGLAAAHDKGIVHRDLKPENLPLDAYRFTPRIAAATPLADGDEIAVGSARMAFRASAAGSTETAAG